MYFAQALLGPEQPQSAFAGTMVSVKQTIRFVSFFRKGTKIQVIL